MAARSMARNSEAGRPNSTTVPALGRYTPLANRTVVVLPHPDGPMRPKIDPAGTARSRCSTTNLPWKRFPASSNVIASLPGAFHHQRRLMGRSTAEATIVRGGGGHGEHPLVVRGPAARPRTAFRPLAFATRSPFGTNAA